MIANLFSSPVTRTTNPKQPNPTSKANPCSNNSKTHKLNKTTQNEEIHSYTRKIEWENRNPYLFPGEWGWRDDQQRSLWLSAWCVWERDETRMTMNSYKSSRENWKSLKMDQFAQNTRFSWLSQVSPGPVARTLKTKFLKNLSKTLVILKQPYSHSV